MLRAGLAFAGINKKAPLLGEIDPQNDGVLTALEVLDLQLSGTQLVVLSACETGLGEIHEGGRLWTKTRVSGSGGGGGCEFPLGGERCGHASADDGVLPSFYGRSIRAWRHLGTPNWSSKRLIFGAARLFGQRL